MKNCKKYISIIFLSFFSSCNIISAGSYPNAETYIFKAVSDLQIVEALRELKKEKPEFEVPNEIDFGDGFTDERKLWYSFYFYDNKERVIYFFLVRRDSENGVEISLISVGKLEPTFQWFDINRDLKGDENEGYKLKFEKKILNKLGLEYKQETFWSIFK